VLDAHDARLHVDHSRLLRTLGERERERETVDRCIAFDHQSFPDRLRQTRLNRSQCRRGEARRLEPRMSRDLTIDSIELVAILRVESHQHALHRLDPVRRAIERREL